MALTLWRLDADRAFRITEWHPRKSRSTRSIRSIRGIRGIRGIRSIRGIGGINGIRGHGEIGDEIRRVGRWRKRGRESGRARAPLERDGTEDRLLGGRLLDSRCALGSVGLLDGVGRRLHHRRIGRTPTPNSRLRVRRGPVHAADLPVRHGRALAALERYAVAREGVAREGVARDGVSDG